MLRNSKLRTSSITALMVMLALLLSIMPVLAQDDEAESTAEPPTDYEIPPPPEGMDPDTVVMVVNEEPFTLADFRARVRYERFFIYTLLENAVRQQATLDALDISDPNNQFAQSIQNFLTQVEDVQVFGEQALLQTVAEQAYIEEANERGIEPDECQLNTAWSEIIFVELGPECEATETFNDAREAYRARAQTLSGISGETLEEIAYARAIIPLVQDAFREDLDIEDVEVVRSRHFRTESEEAALEAIERLEAGENFFVLLEEYGGPAATNAFGNDGVYTFGRGEMVGPFEEAGFNNEIGDVVGPVESQFGYHVIEVMDQQTSFSARQIVLDNEEDAQTALRLLRDEDVEFAGLVEQYSVDMATRATGGDLGFVTPDAVPSAVYEAIQTAEIGDYVGPVETQQGWHVLEVTGLSEEPTSVTARHILVDEEELALELIDRIGEGEEFTALVREYSTDPGAGPRGDTLASFTNNQQRGAYAADQVLEGVGALNIASPEFAEAVFSAEAGDIVGPLNIGQGWFVIEVQEFDVRPPTEPEIDAALDAFLNEWEEERLGPDATERNEIWRQYVPVTPAPSEISAPLAVLDPFAAEARVQIAAQRRAGSIINRLATLRLPESEPEVTPEPESTAEAEATEEPGE